VRLSPDLIPPWLHLVASIISVQIGGALATTLFSALGPNGVVATRTLIAAALFYVLWRPKLRGYTGSDYAAVLLYGGTIAGMMLAYYAAIERIPIGIAVAVAFIGPLGVAVLTSRKVTDLLWVGLGAVGVILLSPLEATTLDPVGLGLSVLSGVLWGIYVFVGGQVTKRIPGNSGGAMGMMVAAVIAFGFGGVRAGTVLTHPDLLLLVLVVAILSSAIPFALQFFALQRLPSRTFGMLLSIEPVVAALVAFLFLGQRLSTAEVLGIGCVTVAAVATARSAKG
jgi:inner membrane transporter RhtA